ncbi:CBS domain-containing protein [Ruminiclostridium josui]|uniref:CBS domain-containing protein n=1 Tax=Ruminiclostridium josui TaxID=1499 RepID=UPI0006D01F8D|nr:CBS domain-containing protein [Ruminiclostridium josui]
MKVKDIMTTNVTYVEPNASIVDTAKLMQQHNVGSIPVCDKGSVVGIVTDRDIVVRNIAVGKNPQQTPVREIMTTGITSVSPDMEMSQVTKMMADSQIRRVPVVDHNNLVGIVALGDVATDAKYDTEVADTLTEISRPSKLNKALR